MTDDATRPRQEIPPEAHAAALKYFQDLFAHRCPACGMEIEREVQGRRCVYAEPCKHVLYQGKVGAFNREKS